jgi:DNA-directed RNA polymerase specialized sigma24 family protein
MSRALEQTGIDLVAESADQVEARLAADATCRAVAAALASPSPGSRGVVLLVAWAELTYGQVAEAPGTPDGVRPRMNGALDYKSQVTRLSTRTSARNRRLRLRD